MLAPQIPAGALSANQNGNLEDGKHGRTRRKKRGLPKDSVLQEAQLPLITLPRPKTDSALLMPFTFWFRYSSLAFAITYMSCTFPSLPRDAGVFLSKEGQF